jgi:phosphosulfolactate synthase (CoM biosynthesis protein A)
VESTEPFGEEVSRDLIRAVGESVDVARLIFELPLPYVQPVLHHEAMGMARWLLQAFGPRVNTANVEPEDAIRVAALRLGIGPATDYEQGAFWRSWRGEFGE